MNKKKIFKILIIVFISIMAALLLIQNCSFDNEYYETSKITRNERTPSGSRYNLTTNLQQAVTHNYDESYSYIQNAALEFNWQFFTNSTTMSTYFNAISGHENLDLFKSNVALMIGQSASDISINSQQYSIDYNNPGALTTSITQQITEMGSTTRAYFRWQRTIFATQSLNEYYTDIIPLICSVDLTTTSYARFNWIYTLASYTSSTSYYSGNYTYGAYLIKWVYTNRNGSWQLQPENLGRVDYLPRGANGFVIYLPVTNNLNENNFYSHINFATINDQEQTPVRLVVDYAIDNDEVSYARGYDAGEKDGLAAGYEKGYTEGTNMRIEDMGLLDWILAVFSTMQDFLNLQIGNVSIGSIILIPLSLSIVAFVLRIWKGGDY